MLDVTFSLVLALNRAKRPCHRTTLTAAAAILQSLCDWKLDYSFVISRYRLSSDQVDNDLEILYQFKLAKPVLSGGDFEPKIQPCHDVSNMMTGPLDRAIAYVAHIVSELEEEELCNVAKARIAVHNGTKTTEMWCAGMAWTEVKAAMDRAHEIIRRFKKPSTKRAAPKAKR